MSMALRNIWFKSILAISVYFSCIIFTLFLEYGAIELFKANEIPVRMYALGGGAIINWLVIAYHSEEKYWRTLLKLLCYSLALLSLIIIGLGLTLLINEFTETMPQMVVWKSLLIIAAGSLFAYGFAKTTNSKWLNS